MSDADKQKRWRWTDACLHMGVLSDKSKEKPNLLNLDPVLLDHVMGLRGATRRAFRDAVHGALDIRIAQWVQTRAFSTLDRRRPRKASFLIDGTPLRVRLKESQDITVDVIGRGGFLADDEINLDAILPEQMLQGCIGRTTSDIFGDADGICDGRRRIVHACIRFSKKTILRLEPIGKKGVDYRRLMDTQPAERFPEYRMTSIGMDR